MRQPSHIGTEILPGPLRTASTLPRWSAITESRVNLLAAELARLDGKIDATTAERHRLADLYQAGLIDLPELHRRSTQVAARLRDLQARRDSLAAERTALAHGNLLRRRVTDFARQIREVIDQLDRPQRQQLVRLLIETSTSPVGTSRSGCGYPSTRPTPARANPGRRG